MEKRLPQQYYGRLWRAIIEFDLIQENDRILIGLSGGKDSLFLTYALRLLQQSSPRNFTLGVLTIDPMFSASFEIDRVRSFCSDLDLPFFSKSLNIAGLIEHKGGNDPCFTCSYFRRGAIHRFAKENGYNKVALAHHHDDAVETFVMGMLYAGQLKTFMPKSYLDRSQLTIIRPLIYLRESEIRDTIPFHGYDPVHNPCPYNGKTKRQEVKELITRLAAVNPAVFEHISAAMRQNPVLELWPAVPSRDIMKQMYLDFWKKGLGPA